MPKEAELSATIPTISPLLSSTYNVYYPEGISKDRIICIKNIRCTGDQAGGAGNVLTPWSVEFKAGYVEIGLKNLYNNTISNTKIEITIVYL